MKNASKRYLWLGPTIALVGLVLVQIPWSTAAAPPKATPATTDPAALEFFETKVRPVLAQNCYSCHGPDVQQANLRLDSRAAILIGGLSGPAMVPGDPAKSPLIAAVHQTGRIKMPMGGKLPAVEIEALSAWVKMGAPWPSAIATAPVGAKPGADGEYVISPEQSKFWSFQPVKMPKPPAVKNIGWVQSPIDRFIMAQLEAKGVKPAPPAARRTLIRRATYDLTGLPPTPAEVQAFVSDRSPNSFAKVVDRLLASPRYGECWARHWLDVARYADTKGYVFAEDRNYPNAYTYRDWVINAFNTDLPYDQFILEQLAADRLPQREQDPKTLAAMGYLTLGRRFLNSQPDIINDRIDVTMRGLEGMTVACARCHNHKFDPIPTKDYYSLYGVFASSQETSPPISPRNISEPYVAYDKRLKDLESQEQALVMAQVDKLREREKNKDAALTQAVHEALQSSGLGARPSPENLAKVEPFFETRTAATLKALREAAVAQRKLAPAVKPEFAMAMEDSPKPVHERVHKHGNEYDLGEDAPPRFLQILSPAQRPIWTQGSGRLELARAIASKSNPLTARVLVNRVWLYHFGAGLVRTPSDFGKQGDRPTNPALLDYLACTFMENDWSIKKLQRAIMLSSAYHMSCDNPSPMAFTVDPENRLISHMNRRRLEFEATRDSLLSASGALDTTKIGGPSVDLWTQPYPARRTVYGFIERQNLPGVFRTFDLASPDTTSPQRFVTTVPQQALFFLNSPFVAQQAAALAMRSDFAKLSESQKIRFLYSVLYGRLPDPQEAIGLQFVHAPPLPAARGPAPIWRYGYGSYNAVTQHVYGFTDLPGFDAMGWHGKKPVPDPDLNWLLLNADGGHPGVDGDHAAIRRWTAPRDGTVAIHGVLKHGQLQGDGVRGRIVSSRARLIAEWTIHNGQAPTEILVVNVQKGDTIDFVVDCRENNSYDAFAWSPTIVLSNGQASWSAHDQFHGPDGPLTPTSNWTRYVQALLMTNEFVFVD